MLWRLRMVLTKWRHLPLLASHGSYRTSIDNNEESREEKRWSREDLIRSADQLLEEHRVHHKTLGLAIAVTVNGRTVYKKAFGLQDMENGVPMSCDTKLKIASVSKLFASHSWLKFMQVNRPDEDVVHLHRVLTEYPKEFYVSTAHIDDETDPQKFMKWKVETNYPIPADAFLTHTSGLFHYTSASSQFSTVRYRSSTQAYRAVDWWHRWKALRMPPGNWYKDKKKVEQLVSSYTSFGTNMLGVMLERMQSLSYDKYAMKLICEMGMNDTLFIDTDESDPVIMDYKTGYLRIDEEFPTIESSIRINENQQDHSNLHPSEGLLCSVGDLVKFGNLYAIMYREGKGPERNRNTGPLKSSKVSDDVFSWYSGDDDENKFGLGWSVEEIMTQGATVGGCRRCKKFDMSASHSGMAVGGQSILLVRFAGNSCEQLAKHNPAARWHSDKKQRPVYVPTDKVPPEIRRHCLADPLPYGPVETVRREREEESKSLEAWRDEKIAKIKRKEKEKLEEIQSRIDDIRDRYFVLKNNGDQNEEAVRLRVSLYVDNNMKRIVELNQQRRDVEGDARVKVGRIEKKFLKQYQKLLKELKEKEKRAISLQAIEDAYNEKERKREARRIELINRGKIEFNQPELVAFVREECNGDELEVVRSEDKAKNTVVVAVLSNERGHAIADLSENVADLFSQYYLNEAK